MKRDLRFEEVYPFSPEQVWRALTDLEAIAEWLMPNNFKPVVGHEFEFRVPPQPGWDGIVKCRVLEVTPPRFLSYTWNSAGGAVDTVVRWTLEPVSGGTKLVLEHTNFRGAKALMISFILGSGWKGQIKKGIPDVIRKRFS
jgi:uncharacterized protein YndB with AHSA1/START domain